MIAAVKPKLKEILTEIGAASVYMDVEEESRIKGADYAALFEVEPERMERDGQTVVSCGANCYLREYELRQKLGLRIVTKTEEEAQRRKHALLAALAQKGLFQDAQGFEIEVDVLSAELLADKSVLKTGSGYAFILELGGGVYRPVCAQLDPWLRAVGEWSLQALNGPDLRFADEWVRINKTPWRVYPYYPLGEPEGSMYWQIADSEVEECGNVLYTVRKKLMGRFFARDDLAMQAAVKLTQMLATAYKIPLDAAARKYLTVQQNGLDMKRGGAVQIAVTFRRNTQKPIEEFPLIQSVGIQGELQGG